MDKMTGKVVRTEADWAALVDACERAGQSAAVFCKGQGVSYSLFLYYRRKILKKRFDVQSIARLAVGAPIPRAVSFIPVRIESRAGMRLKFPMGLVLESDEILPASWVAEVTLRWTGAGGSSC